MADFFGKYHGSYDPSKVVVTVAEQIITGFASDDFVSVVMDEDIYQKIRGADGEVTRVRNSAISGVIELKLMASAPSNSALNSLLSTPNPFTIGINDLSGTTVLIATRCWLKKAPDLAMSKAIGETLWVFDCADIQTQFGGAKNATFASIISGVFG